MDRPTTTALAEKFMARFAGMNRAYGTYTITNTRSDGKAQGDEKSIKTHKAAVTVDLWENHLNGKQGIGIIPIRDGNDCTFGAIDIDIYPLDHKGLAQRIKNNKLPLVVCRTKSGGAHLYCFTKVPVPAARMKSKLSEVAAFLGYGKSEIFPKQESILAEQGDVGQWINMPYFNGTRGMRYAIDLEGNAMAIEDFLMYADYTAVEENWFNELLIIANEFEDGPPCLQALSQVGYPTGTRNNGLYNIGVYLRKSNPDSWERLLEDMNVKLLQPPLTGPEVQGVIKSINRKDYFYKCSDHPIAQYCNTTLCRTRKFGVGGSGAGKFPVLGGLTKLNTKPPIWFWTVDGSRIELSTSEIQDPRQFQRKCMDYCSLMITLPTAPVWNAAVQHALDNVTIIDAPVDASPEGQFWEMVEKFCSGRAQALSLDEIISGKPFTEKTKTYFRMADLLGFLSRHKFFEFKSPKIASMLKDAGAEHHTGSLKGRFVNYWSLPAFVKQTSGFDVPGEIEGQGDVF